MALFECGVILCNNDKKCYCSGKQHLDLSTMNSAQRNSVKRNKCVKISGGHKTDKKF